MRSAVLFSIFCAVASANLLNCDGSSVKTAASLDYKYDKTAKLDNRTFEDLHFISPDASPVVISIDTEDFVTVRIAPTVGELNVKTTIFNTVTEDPQTITAGFSEPYKLAVTIPPFSSVQVDEATRMGSNVLTSLVLSVLASLLMPTAFGSRKMSTSGTTIAIMLVVMLALATTGQSDAAADHEAAACEARRVEVQVLAPLAMDTFTGMRWIQVEVPKHTTASKFSLQCPRGFSVSTTDVYKCVEIPLVDTEQETTAAQQVYTEVLTIDSQEETFYQKNFNGTIMAECFAVNGNGYNWASTLSFLAEALEVRASKAEKAAADTGKTVYVYPHCIVGGSSGSAVVGVYLSLLRNDNLFKQGEVREIKSVTAVGGAKFENVRLYTPEQTRMLAQCLRFTALGVDFSTDEVAEFLPVFLGSQIGAGVSQRLNWWPQNMDPMKAQVLFSSHALSTRYATLADFYQVPIEKVIEDSGIVSLWSSIWGDPTEPLEQAAAGGDVMYGLDVLTEGGSEERKNKVDLVEAQHMWAQRVGHQINQRRYEESDAWYILRVINADITKDTPLNHMLNESLPVGFSTMSMARLFDTVEEMDQSKDIKPDYEDIRPVMACSLETLTTILGNADYQNDIQNQDKYALRYIYIVVDTYFQAFDFGVREPLTFGILAKQLPDLGVTQFYDPLLDSRINGAYTFAPIDLSATLQTEEGKVLSPSLAVMGGYPSGNMMALGQHYFVEGIFESLKSLVPLASVEVTHTRYLKHTTPRFAESVIKKILCGPEDAADFESICAPKISDWADFDSAFERLVPGKYAALSANGAAISTAAGKVNWDMPSGGFLPPAVTGDSYIITPRAVQAGRDQLDSATTYPKAVFLTEEITEEN